MIEYSNKKIIEVNDWDDLVQKTYNKPYSFKQQEGCQDRGTYYLTVTTSDHPLDDFVNESVPEIINGEEMGVRFSSWLNTAPLSHSTRNNWKDWRTCLFWERNFYPNIETLATDLCKKGLIEEGEYIINIDW